MTDKKIERLTPIENNPKKKIGKLNDNPHHKDHFEYNYELGTFKYPENEYRYSNPNK